MLQLVPLMVQRTSLTRYQGISRTLTAAGLGMRTPIIFEFSDTRLFLHEYINSEISFIQESIFIFQLKN